MVDLFLVFKGISIPARLLCPWDFSDKEHWSGLPFPPPGDPPDPGIELCVWHWQAGSFPLSHQGSPKVTLAVVTRCAGEAEWLCSVHPKEGSPSTQQPGKICRPSKPPPYSSGLITNSVPVLLCWREGLLVLAFTCFR